jgi:hypothetical protein
MKTLIRLTEMLLRILLWAIIVIACCTLFSCRGVQYVPVETVRTETERVVDVVRDSIHVMDSVFIREKADTVFITKWRVEFREALRVDTFQIYKVDSVQTIVEVEKKLTKWQQTKMDVGAGALYAVPILLAVGLYILYRKLKK